MVFVSKLTFAAALSALVGTVVAQSQTFQIFEPSTSWWWVANSENVMSWDCKNSPVQQFTVFIINSNPSVLSGRLAFIAEQTNADCSEIVAKTEINQAPAPGYQLQYADVLNSSLIYATSEPFEIKAAGSTYPTSSAVGSATASSTGSGAKSTSSSHSGASSVKASMGIGLAAVGAVLGFITA